MTDEGKIVELSAFLTNEDPGDETDTVEEAPYEGDLQGTSDGDEVEEYSLDELLQSLIEAVMLLRFAAIELDERLSYVEDKLGSRLPRLSCRRGLSSRLSLMRGNGLHALLGLTVVVVSLGTVMVFSHESASKSTEPYPGLVAVPDFDYSKLLTNRRVFRSSTSGSRSAIRR